MPVPTPRGTDGHPCVGCCTSPGTFAESQGDREVQDRGCQEAHCLCLSKQPSTENAIFGTCCDITTHRTRQRRTLDHHVFDSTNDRWVKRQSLPQPTRHLLVKLIPDDHDRLKIAQRPRRAQCYVDGMPDTGCQSCLAGTHILRQLGISRENLIPVSQRMQAANKSGIHLLGAEFSLPDTKAKSKQMVYVTPSVTRLFLTI